MSDLFEQLIDQALHPTPPNGVDEDLLELINGQKLYTNVLWQDYAEEDEDRQETWNLTEAEAVASEIVGDPGKHKILLDIDVPATANGDVLTIKAQNIEPLVDGAYHGRIMSTASHFTRHVTKLGMVSRVATFVDPSYLFDFKGELQLTMIVPFWLIPSSTPGHNHLYVDLEVESHDYFLLLDFLVRAGIIEPGYMNASIERGFTSLRLPWIKKEAA